MAALSASELAAIYLEAHDKKFAEDVREKRMAEYRELVDGLPVSYIGPTWQRDEFGKWLLPKLTLGWQVIGWISEFIQLPGSDGPGRLTKEQVRFLLWWYAIDERGEFIYRTGVLQRCKGWGKDPVMAMLCLVEFVGPARFSHWHPLTGEPVGMQTPEGWVQIAAVAREQTKNTVQMFPAMMTKHMIQTYGIKAGSELWRADGGRRRMEIITSNPGTIQGNRSTFVCMNETHEWTPGRRGKELYEVLDGNVSKVDGRWLAITNAFMPGQDSVAEELRQAAQDIWDGRSHDVGMFYDSIEADPRSPMTPEAMRIILPKVFGDAFWLNPEALIKSALTGSRAVSKSRRMYYNQIVASEDAIYSDVEWKAIEDRDLELRPGDKIVLGFDGSKSRDATALVAIRVKDMFATPVPLGDESVAVWERPPGAPDDWQIDRVKVNSAVAMAFRKYKVVGFYADVAEWTSYIDDWHERYGEGLVVKSPVGKGNAIAWDMRRNGAEPTYAHMRLFDSVVEGKLRHNGQPDLRRHALNARARENSYGLGFGKDGESSEKKVDAYAALMLAHECLHDFRTRQKTEAVHSGEVWFL